MTTARYRLLQADLATLRDAAIKQGEADAYDAARLAYATQCVERTLRAEGVDWDNLGSKAKALCVSTWLDAYQVHTNALEEA